MESFKQKRANLLNNNPIASHGSWISKHSIAAGSPVHMGGSGKSPLYQDDLREGDFRVTQSTTGLGGEIIPTERQAVIPGQEVEKFAQPGTPEYDRWLAAFTKDPSIEDKYKDRTITQTRDVNVEQPKQYVNIFKGLKREGLDEKYTTQDSLPYADQVGIAKSINMPPKVFKKQFTKVTGLGFRKKPRTTTSSTSGSQNIGDWTTVE